MKSKTMTLNIKLIRRSFLHPENNHLLSETESETAGNTAVEYPSMKVTRSIMIVKPERTLSDTPPASPAGSTPPVSPFAGKL